MSQPTTTAETEQTALEAMLDALVAIVEAEIAELPITGRVIPFPTVL
ncbi:hypothetical protein ACQKQD_24150 [Methylobacterium sp. NPDC080182]